MHGKSGTEDTKIRHTQDTHPPWRRSGKTVSPTKIPPPPYLKAKPEQKHKDSLKHASPLSNTGIHKIEVQKHKKPPNTEYLHIFEKNKTMRESHESDIMGNHAEIQNSQNAERPFIQVRRRTSTPDRPNQDKRIPHCFQKPPHTPAPLFASNP